MRTVMTASDLWSRCLDTIRDETESQSYQTWFEPTRGLELTDESLKIQVPNRFFADWLEEHYKGLICRALEEHAGESIEPEFQVAHRRPDQYEPVSTRRVEPPPLTIAAADECQLNPRYTFSTFIVGASNRFAQAASMAVAEAPAETYNPLFIHGGVGLGKTHLMQAIGNYVREQRPGLSIYYVSSETFMNELITSIQRGTTLEFRDKYRSKDILLIDDVQFLAGKESTQEEFFHTFNALYLAHKQIVLTSDRPPKQISTLEERLVSRFESGLVTDIQPPDLETRIAILHEKAELDGISIPNDVIHLVANSVTSNIRELEGSLVRLLAFSSLTGSEITVELAREVLSEFLGKPKGPISVARIQQAVAETYGVPVEKMKARGRASQIALARQVAMYLARELTHLSLAQIGEQFGGRDHTTVLHAHRKVTGLVEDGGQVQRDIENLRRVLRAG
ncbi:MAG: chromosomal replication initiator protein DnaA [Candidatus Eisenbacteria bacterium]|nr:chromosomal replication initiator protein DnaA [Candidatus Eisenbacteria bacterium]